MEPTLSRPSRMSVLRTGTWALLTPRRLLTMALLVAAWCALWGSVSVANVASGTLVAVAATTFAGIEPDAGGLRIVPLLHFLWLVLVDLIVSTVYVAWEILTPKDHTDEAIIAVDAQVGSRSHFLMLVVAITVTPGTAVIDTDGDTGRLYLHLLHAEKAPEIERHVRHLAELACRALPVGKATS
ncbi:MAG TPA: Na+/H+ antiporter subunit E [Ilumatobacteraceae bacterium]|nr:Na+/H+ antiporter subunit E [Ilumatobacteraceae bacterium]